MLLLGDMRETLRVARGRRGGRVALAHLDPGTGDVETSRALVLELAPTIAPLLRSDAILVSEAAIALPELAPLPLPEGVAPGRYHIYRRVNSRS